MAEFEAFDSVSACPEPLRFEGAEEGSIIPDAMRA
ncbi:MAG: hypothetical protein ACJAT5_000439 [Lentimonas sp.]|jgi:hypothetical protein